MSSSEKSSPRAPRFQHSVHEIPTPGIENNRPPRYEHLMLNFWIIGGVALIMISLGIGLEVALSISDRQSGFAVPATNVFGRFASTQVLTSFFPTLLVVPLALYWAAADWMLRWYQPYITLSEGSAPASRSLLLDYVALNQLFVVYYSMKHKHFLIIISSFIAFAVMLLQPLAGSLFQVRQIPYTTDSVALVTRGISLSPTIDNLEAFFSSTGFALASVYDKLDDPPFVHEVWTAAPFEPPPASYLNGTLAVNVTAIRTQVNCVSSASLNVTNVNGNYAAVATFPNGCSASNVFKSSNGTNQFSVVNASSCASSDLDIVFQPVVFWYYLQTTRPQVASVYCNPTMNVFTVETSTNLSNGALGPCTMIQPAGGNNNVSGSPQNGRPYNGVVFDPSDDFYITSRASAINFGIPNAIYLYASQQLGGPLSVFQDEFGFLNATTTVYTRHLALAAKSNYFLANDSIVPAHLTSEVPRLFIEPVPAHLLSCVMVLVGIIGAVIHHVHRRARRKLWLTSPPGSIAAIVSLTSRSGFGDLLLPYDDERRIRSNLDGLAFRLDQRTGAIVAEEDVGATKRADGEALLGRRRAYESPSFIVDDNASGVGLPQRAVGR